MNKPTERERIYDIVLAARTEGIVGGETKWLAEKDTDSIINLINELLDGLTVIEVSLEEANTCRGWASLRKLFIEKKLDQQLTRTKREIKGRLG